MTLYPMIDEQIRERRKYSEAELSAISAQVYPEIVVNEYGDTAQKEEGWKDVKKELPPPNPKKSWKDGPNFRDAYQASDTVLAFNGCITTAEALTNPKGETVWVCGDETVKGVTHWRELPSPPLRARRECERLQK